VLEHQVGVRRAVVGLAMDDHFLLPLFGLFWADFGQPGLVLWRGGKIFIFPSWRLASAAAE